METGNVAKKSIFESILAKHLVLNFFELIRNFIKLLIREVLLPCREDDSVLAGGMVRVHQHEAVKYFFQGFGIGGDRKSTRLNSSHSQISYAVFCLKKKKI